MADHDTGNVVRVGRERSKAAFEDVVAAFGPTRTTVIEAISVDGTASSYRHPRTIPHA